ncbi:DUF2235 domain-containing protein [Massilia sp. CCM 9210]|uniref:KfrB domain-containing protein n=1 Tax=Massilia scottii TaxID=3057166 RepID=UPI002796C98C|nr:DUF2235 domain-containing protein [Massilia sp. CCM 9210]MDQ1815787.1 DUF2235 domain-containing protein [Massilia sp. CCM 9210]
MTIFGLVNLPKEGSPDGVDVVPATTEQLGQYDKAGAKARELKVPELYNQADPKARVFVAMFDGTGNDLHNDREHITNIGMLKDQVDQLSYKNKSIGGHYIEGPGTQEHYIPRTIDGITGGTYQERIDKMFVEYQKQAAIWLKEDPDCKISVLSTGFSRGAEQAAGFTRLVHERGIPAPINREHPDIPDPPLRAPGTIPQAVMLYDPVATGEPGNNDRRLPPSVVTGMQITVSDEHRTAFASTSIIGQGLSDDGRFVAVPVPGAHSNGGGGYLARGLSDRSFNLAVDFENRVLGGDLLKKVEVSNDPKQNVIHKSEQHKWVYRAEPERRIVELPEREAADPILRAQYPPKDAPVVTPAPAADPKVEFGNKIQGAGLELKEAPVMDGTLQRVPVAGGAPGNRDGAYTGHLDGHPHGQITNFASGHKENWSKDGLPLTDKQQGQLTVDAQNARQQRGAELAEQYNNVAAKTSEKLERLPDTPPAGGNAYLASKQIDGHGVKFDGDKVVVPLRDIDGKIWSAQTISPGEDGGSTFEKGGRRVGNMHIIGDIKPGSDVLVADGYASAASLHQATGKPTVVAFDARNMDAVVDSVKSHHPTNPVHIMADHAGVEKATAAAEKHQVGIAFPESKTGAKVADFNELHVREGLPAVKEQVDKAVARSVDHSLEQATSAARAQRGDGAEVKPASHDSKHTGPVTAVTSYHAVQAVGEKSFVAHELRDLPSVPVQNKPVTIEYQDGRAQMTDKAPERAAATQDR